MDLKGLFVLGKFDNNKYEFIFTNFVTGSPRLFTTVQAVFRSLFTPLAVRTQFDAERMKLPDFTET